MGNSQVEGILRIKLDDQVSKSIKNIEKNVSHLQKSTGDQTKMMSSMWNGLRGAIVGAIAAISIEKLVSLGASMLQGAGDVQQMRIAMDTLAGSSEKAQVLMEKLVDLSISSPFEFTQLMDASKKLMAYGFSAEDAYEKTKLLGDISAAIGIEKLPNLAYALGQIKAAGRLMGTELRQLAETGFPIVEALSEHLGKNISENIADVSQMGITYEDVVQAMQKWKDAKFPDILEKQNRSLVGVTSNLKEMGLMIFRTIGGVDAFGNVIEGGMLDTLGQQLLKLYDWWALNKDAVAQFAVTLSKKAGQAITMAIDAVRSLYQLYKDMPVIIDGFRLKLEELWGRLEQNATWQAFITILGWVKDAFVVFTTSILPYLIATFNIVWGVIESQIIPSMQKLWESVENLIQTFAGFLDRNRWIIAILEILAKVVGTAVAIAFGVLMFVIKSVIDTVGFLIRAFELSVVIFDAVVSSLMGIYNAIVDSVMGALEGFYKWLNKNMPFLADLFDSVTESIKDAYNWLLSLLGLSGKEVKVKATVDKSEGGSKGKDNKAIGGIASGGRMMLVGENGPEVIAPPNGARIMDARSSQQAMSSPINVTINVNGGISDESMVRRLAKEIEVITSRQNRLANYNLT